MEGRIASQWEHRPTCYQSEAGCSHHVQRKKKADEGDEEYKPKGMPKVGSLKGFGKPKSYHPLKDAKTANY